MRLEGLQKSITVTKTASGVDCNYDNIHLLFGWSSANRDDQMYRWKKEIIWDLKFIFFEIRWKTYCGDCVDREKRDCIYQ